MPVLDTPTALHMLAGSDSVYAYDVARLYLQKGSDPNAKNRDGLTPVHVASIWGAYELLRLLLLNGGDAAACDVDGLDALQHAIHVQQLPCAQLIRSHLQIQGLGADRPQRVFAQIQTAPARVANDGNRDTGRGRGSADWLSEDTSRVTVDIPKAVENGQPVPRYDQWFAPKDTPRNRHCSPWRCFVPGKGKKQRESFSPPYVNTPSSYDNKTVSRETSAEEGSLPVLDTAFNLSPSQLFSDISAAEPSGSKNCTIVPKLYPDINKTATNKKDEDDEDSFVSLLNATLQLSDTNNETLYESASDVAADWMKQQGGDNDVLNDALLLHCTRMDDHTLRADLTTRGTNVGPIDSSTRMLYARRLAELMREDGNTHIKSTDVKYSRELALVLTDVNRLESVLCSAAVDERMMIECFEQPNRVWREGALRMSFCYLLVDPEAVEVLMDCKHGWDDSAQLRQFVRGVFYIGKAKKSRPYQHLIQAAEYNHQSKPSVKLSRIQQIWASGRGVVSVHVFQNVLAAEAYTREAAMIDAIDIANVSNLRKGDYYGVTTTWTTQRRRNLGVHLLYNAMRLMMLEGARELRQNDVILDVSN